MTFITTSLIGNDENEQCTIFSALEFKTKKLLEVADNVCDWNIVKTDMITDLIDSGDDYFYLEFSGEDSLLERISIEVNNNSIKIIEDPIIIENLQTITGDHPFFKTEGPKGMSLSGIFQIRKPIIDGYLLFENGSFWKLPILKVYAPQKCSALHQQKTLNIIKENSKEIYDFLIKKLHLALDNRLDPHAFDLAVEYINQNLLYILFEIAQSSYFNDSQDKIINEIESKYQDIQKIVEKEDNLKPSVQEKSRFAPYRDLDFLLTKKSLFRFPDELDIKKMILNFQSKIKKLL